MPRNGQIPPHAVTATAVAAQIPALHERMTVEQGFSQIISDCLAQIRGNQMALIHDDDPEGLHQMRIGLRRLRSALKLFRRTVPVPLKMQEQLNWLSSVLGPARDWEVLCTATLTPFATAAPNDHGLQTLLLAATEMARDLRKHARVAVQSPRFADLLLIFSGWLEGAAWRNAMPKSTLNKLEASLPRFAEKSRGRNRRRMFRRTRKLDIAAPTSYHNLRIATKSARYAAEFFRALYPTKPMRVYIHRLVLLQDELGRRNDAAVADRLLQELDEIRPDLHVVIELVRDALKSKFDGKARRLRRMWKRFESSKAPRRK